MLGGLVLGIDRKRTLEEYFCLDWFSHRGQNCSVPSMNPSILRLQGKTLAVRCGGILQAAVVVVEGSQRSLRIILIHA